ncbi:MAG: GNAT family N-acetyltransferase [Verrucomicrobiae bacterium]|nr:GNAT family N-acetyltransferase [Verrucomicrobiae bacterium]
MNITHTHSPRVVPSTDPRDPEWDAWVARHPQPHPEQSSGWGDAQRIRGWEPCRWTLREGDRLLGGVQVLVRPAPRLGHVAYIQRGPLLLEEAAHLAPLLLQTLRTAAAQRRWAYLSMVLPYQGGPSEAALRAAGYFPQPALLPPQTSEAATLVVDLTPPEEEILARMRRTTRRYIRQGQERGLLIRSGSESDLDTFGQLMLALCARRGVRSNIPAGEFLHRVWQAFHPGGHIRLFLAQHDARPIAGLIVLALGTWARAWRIGWSGEAPDLRPNESLYWAAMRWARESGHRHFDFMGFETNLARALAEGRQPSPSSLSSLAQFKLGLGGIPMVLRPFQCRFFHPLVQLLLRAGGHRLLDWPPLRRLLPRRLLAGAHAG